MPAAPLPHLACLDVPALPLQLLLRQHPDWAAHPTAVVDRDTQEKIDIVKGRLIKNYGYCDVCAVDVLNYVASIFARGDSKQR